MFSWNSLFDNEARRLAGGQKPRFNPCFPGTRSSTALYGAGISAIECFNPCFPGTRSSTLRFIPRESSVHWVSILVFLELALRPRSTQSPPPSSPRFNPCFPGTRSSTIAILMFADQINCFNPCFPGTRSSTRRQSPPSVLKPQFQSLFSWNSLFDSTGSAVQTGSTYDVSILVFLELALRPEPVRGGEDILPVSILVFLELALRRQLYNPFAIFMMSFQSLFSWNSLFDNNGYNTVIHSHPLFQSLFSWNSLFDL